MPEILSNNGHARSSLKSPEHYGVFFAFGGKGNPPFPGFRASVLGTYLLQVSLTIFSLVTSRSAYYSFLDAFTTPSRFSSAFSCALDSRARGPVTVTV